MLLLMLIILYFYISTFRSMCALPNMAVFCSSLISCFPGMLLGYYLYDFGMVPIVPIFTDIITVFVFQMCPISVVWFFILGSSSYLIFMTFFSFRRMVIPVFIVQF